jgi:tRNA (guanine10-N2)-dimethyltransferase
MQTLENEKSTDRSVRLFFILSGEHLSLPAAEVLAILDAENIPAYRVESSYRLLKLDATPDALQHVSNRSLMYDKCGYLLGECEADDEEIHKLIAQLPLDSYVSGATTYAVRSERLGGVKRNIRRTALERSVGSLLKGKAPNLRVQLKEPDLTFLCVIYEESFVFGITRHAKPPGPISRRRPRKRPVFHPSTMPPKIARCMVNLSRASPGGIFLDPFCGVGGVLIEGAVVGCRVIGMDRVPRMLRGARKNLRYFGLDSDAFLCADARHLPFQTLDAIATDPPYGRGSSTRGEKVDNLVRDFLSGIGDSLRQGSHVCIAAPVEVGVEDYAKDAGFKTKERHLFRVHRSLTRQFVVLQNP